MVTLTPAQVYDETRRRIVALVGAIDDATADTVVPACPAWTVRDTVAHVVGIVDDLQAGRVEGLGSDTWTDAQVQRRRGATLAEICAEWEALTADLATLGGGDAWMVTRLVADLVTHEHDLRGALGRPGARDNAAIGLGLARYAPFFVERVEQAGPAPLAVQAGSHRWEPTAGPAAGVVQGSPFEVLRALTGRRSRAQARRLDWQGVDPEPHLPLISPYGQPEDDLIE